MGLMSRLARLDAVVLPRLARGLNRIRRRVRRWRIRPLAAVATALLLAVAVTGVWRLVRSDRVPTTGTSPIWVGVRDGDSVPRYVELAEAKLSALVAGPGAEPVYALVAFTEYISPEQVRVVVAASAGVDPVLGYARVPLPRRQTERVVVAANVIPGDMLAAMATIANRKAVDAETYRALAAAESAEALKAIYVSNAEVSQAEAEGYRGGCACVFALLVRGAPDALAALASRPGVRAVDPATDVVNIDDAVFAAPLPEQTDRVEPPVDDLFSSPAPLAGP